jgi:nucleotide-binding universal stress UspA family protein
MKHLLCATDFSDGGNNAVAYAAAMASSSSATLHLLHAYKSQTSAATVFKGLNEILEADAKEALEGLKEALLQIHPGLKVIVYAAFGHAAEVIAAKADALSVDMMVVGTRGKSLLDTLFFGSTSTALCKRAGRPLLLVPPSCSFGVGKEVAYATALRTDVQPSMLSFLKHFGEVIGKNFSVIHVYDGDHPLTPAQELRHAQLQEVLGIPKNVQHLIHNEDVIAAILAHVTAQDSSVLALHLYHYGFLERLFVPSVADALLSKAKLPLLLLPVAAATAG